MADVDERTRHAMPEIPNDARTTHDSCTRIPLKENWDSALTYDVLDPDQERRNSAEPVFVGRSELLGSLVNAISRPEIRGTYLVSGYRGAGKTSLVIEASRQGR